MNTKETIEKLLFDLKKLGYSRRQIEAELGYADKYLDQTLSKGGTLKVVGALERFYVAKSNPLAIKNTDLNEQIGTIEERLMRLESYTTVLFDTAVATIAQASGRPDSLIRAELQQAVVMVSKHALDELRQKG